LTNRKIVNIIKLEIKKVNVIRKKYVKNYLQDDIIKILITVHVKRNGKDFLKQTLRIFRRRGYESCV